MGKIHPYDLEGIREKHKVNFKLFNGLHAGDTIFLLEWERGPALVMDINPTAVLLRLHDGSFKEFVPNDIYRYTAIPIYTHRRMVLTELDLGMGTLRKAPLLYISGTTNIAYVGC